MHNIITIGSATRDVFLVSKQFIIIPSPEFETGLGECVSFGSKIELEDVIHSTGGGATNAAVTFARLGYKTAAICRVGKDRDGDDVIEDLQKENVATSLVRRIDKGKTGYSTIMTTPSGERSILVHRGVSKGFIEADIPWERCDSEWLYLTSLGGAMTLAKKIITFAKDNKISIAWNPGKTELKSGWKNLEPLFQRTDVLLMNTEEALIATSETDLDVALGQLASCCTKEHQVLLVTDGADGAYAFYNDTWWFAWTLGKKALSKTGAGDAFGSGFVAAWQKTGDPHYSLAHATYNAETVVQSFGAKTGILDKFISQVAAKKIKISKLA